MGHTGQLLSITVVVVCKRAAISAQFSTKLQLLLLRQSQCPPALASALWYSKCVSVCECVEQWHGHLQWPVAARARFEDIFHLLGFCSLQFTAAKQLRQSWATYDNDGGSGSGSKTAAAVEAVEAKAEADLAGRFASEWAPQWAICWHCHCLAMVVGAIRRRRHRHCGC